MAKDVMGALAAEVDSQPQALERFAKSKLPRARRGSVFAGAGDSFAAALAGFYASGGRCLAIDPYSLARSPEVAEGVDVYFISISGRTSSNLLAAKRVKGFARKVVAITADGESELAGEAGRVVRLPMEYVPKTPGLLSFSLSLLAVLRISGGRGDFDFRRALEAAKKDSRKVVGGSGTTYFLGNSLGYPAALYSAAKTYELVGARAHPELLEEFSHLQLFSLRRRDAVNIFSCFDPSGQAAKLRSALGGRGYSAGVIPSHGQSDGDRLVHAVFVAQLAALHRAAAAGLARPRFLSSGARLGVSDEMIY